MTTKTKPRTKYDRRFPMPTQQTQDEWSAYMQRADEVAYRLLYQSQEHELNNYDHERSEWTPRERGDTPYNAETDNG